MLGLIRLYWFGPLIHNCLSLYLASCSDMKDCMPLFKYCVDASLYVISWELFKLMPKRFIVKSNTRLQALCLFAGAVKLQRFLEYTVITFDVRSTKAVLLPLA